ncbi:MAG: 1-deoxy-D-xylulose-5-phosphate synthase [Firmicutes bacterium]|nr:1-deoxy-D-xylulose-5-phosphate synthase [Bacillota bacterium]
MGEILQNIFSPVDLKKLPENQLEKLAREIREFLLESVAQTGGHLAANLGIVELTIALHYVFDSPTDQIIWDVGHQSYVHKILTGRWPQFGTLRQYNGLSGFPKPEESVHDIFITGHSSTSISTALGLAKGRDLLGAKNKVIAVIGDGSMTGGMAFEALNHLGHLETDLIVILNDNEMSISKNVGALSRYLTRLRLNPFFRKLKYNLRKLVWRIPKIGQGLVRIIERLENGLTFLVLPGVFFKELGISYLGPVDGHNIQDLIPVLRHAAGRKGPVLIHVLTTKGKGYDFAEQNPQKYHGTAPFLLENGQKRTEISSLSYTEIFATTICELAQNNPKIVAFTAAMADGTGLVNFAKKFPDRFFDVGIAEEHAVAMAAGLAKKGFQPVVVIYSTFLQRAYDQIIHDVCLQNLPVVFMLDRAGLVGPDGPTHHGVFDLSYLRHIPNLVIMAPKDEYEFQDMIFTAFRLNRPVAVRYPKRDGLGFGRLERYREIPFGKGEVLVQGQNIALIGVGSMAATALQAANRLQNSGINLTVANARFIKPLDEALIASLAAGHKHLVTLEENVLAGGFGSAVAQFIAGRRFPGAPSLKMLGIPDQFITHGDTGLLLQKCGLDVDGVCRTIRELYLPVVGIRARI